MTSSKIREGDLLFHATHGLCRVERLIQQDHGGRKALHYALVPKVMSKMKVRFVVPESDMEVSGFHRLVSPQEAKKILGYLKAGDGSAVRTEPAWTLARNILCFSMDQLKARDQRKRQLLEHSVKGLVGEFSCVLKISLKETARKVQQSLGSGRTIHPLILAAFAHASEN